MKKTTLPPLPVTQAPGGVLQAGLLCLSLLFTAATASATTFTVTNTNNSGAGSLRQALLDANGNGSSPHTINITASGTITVTTELPAPVFATTINGNGCTISGGGTTRIFASMQANGADIAVTFNVLNFTAGSGSGGNGGAFEIRQGYRVTFTDCKFYSNTASGFGGAICYNVSGSQIGSMRPLVCTRCSFTNNTSTGSHSGGVDNRNGNATFTNCTFANNTAAGVGGAYSTAFNTEVSNFINCTIANNSCATANAGGGLALVGAKNMLNNIVYGNTANNVSNDINNGSGTMTQVSNLVGTTTGTAVSWALTSNPNLGTITTCSNGISYLPLTTGSPAINAGSASGASLTAPSTDVCGAARSGNPDLGSSEFVTPTLPEINVQGASLTILDGDNTPSTTDGTDHGTVLVNAPSAKTFTIQNTGTGNLTVSTITMTGTNQSEFVVSGITLPATIAAGSSTTFTVTFTPTATGLRSAVIHVNNNDSDEADYDFALQGTGAVPGAGLAFDGSDDYVNVPFNAAFNITGNVTLEAWVKTSISTEQYIISRGNTSYLLAVNPGGGFPGKAAFWVHGPSSAWLYSNTSIADGNWHHVAGVRNGTTVQLFIDGVLDATAAVGSGAITTGTDPVAIGWRSTYPTSVVLNGSADEVRIWSVARTCDQINQQRNCELAGNESGLVAYYKFNQGFAGGNNSATTTLTDATANGLNGTLTNFALSGTSSNWVTPGGVTTGTSCSSVTAPEINLQGASVTILDGDNTPSTADGTDFGSILYSASVVRTFTIQNTGTAVLNITSITSSNAKYVIGSAPTSVAANSSATFTVTFTPAETGTHTATITINNNDCDESVYDFAVTGTATFPVTTLGFDCVSGAIGNYYNGGSGPNVGIGFPNGTAVNAALDANTNPVINVPPGFTTGFAVQGNVCIGYTITIYSGLDGTGTVLATQGGNPGLRSVAFSGIAKSVTLSRWSCPAAGYDNLTFGSTTIGTTVVESPREINLQGNSQTILDGDATPATTDGTDFGSATSRSFTIQNSGNAALTISAITLSGTNASDFSISGISLPATVSAGGSTTFTVNYTITGSGIRTATVNIANDDCDESTYDFAIQAAGCVAPTFSACPTNTTVNTAAGLCTTSVLYIVEAGGTPAPTLTYAISGATTGSGSGTGSGTTFNKGVSTVTVTATNPCGAPGCVFNVTVNDNQAPVITCPAAVSANANEGNCFATEVALGTATATDNCGTPSITQNAPTSFPVGATTVIWTATDASGLTATCTQVVTVNDNQNPTITCPAAVTANTDAGLCTASGVALGTATGSDNCGTPTFSNDAPTAFQLGNTTVTWVANDGHGNTVSCTQTVTVNDNQNPTITCPATVTVNAETGLCTASSVALGTATGSDNCGTPTFSNNAPTTYAFGNTTVTWTADDSRGNTASCAQIVTVNDNQNPTITCPAAVSVNADAGLCTASGVALGTATGSDNCGTVTFSNNAPSAFPVGNNTVIWTANDGHGNTATCTQTVTVSDNQAPTAICQNYTAQLNASGTVTITGANINNNSTDNCGIASLSVTPNTFTCASIANNPHTVTLTVTDNSGNTAACTALVTVADNVPPTTACQNLTVQLDGNGQATITADDINNGSTDACGIASTSINVSTFDCDDIPVIVPVNLLGRVKVYYAGGVKTYDLTAANLVNWNNFSSCAGKTRFASGSGLEGWQWTDVLPSGTAVTSIEIQLSFDFSSSNAARQYFLNGVLKGSQAGPNDGINCSGVNANFTLSGANYVAGGSNTFSWDLSASSYVLINNTFPPAIVGTPVVLTVTDIYGNSANCTAYVTAEDNVAPVAICKNSTINLNAAGQASITVSDVNNGSSDNCGIASMELSATQFTCANAGPNTVTLTVFDNNNITNTCTATVTVRDLIAPTAVCQNTTVQLNAAGTGSITAAAVNNGSADNCGIQSLALSQTAFTCANVGANTVTLTVTDNSANTATCTATITVQDNVAPTAVCQNVTVQLNAAGTATTTAAAVNNGSSDACGIQSTTLSQTAFTCSNAGANTVTLTVTDVNANTATCTATVTVQDLIAPTAVCQNVTVQLGANGTASTTAAAVNNGSSDNCGVQSLSLSQTNFTCSNAGANTVTLTVTDVNANTATCTATVTVQDLIVPTAVCQNITVNLNAAGTASATAAAVNNGSSDNCSIQNMTLSQTAFTCANVGANAVTLTVTDPSGNTATCSATVTVVDNIAPTVVCQNVTVQLNAAGQGSATASQVVVTGGGAGGTTQTINFSGGITQWVVPSGVTSINLTAKGAKGGDKAGGRIGGSGAIMQGDFAVTPGETLNILVGQAGGFSSSNTGAASNTSGGGGGGGTFVWRGTFPSATLLIAAGGGGGASKNDPTPRDATTALNGQNGSNGGAGGINGLGGAGSSTTGGGGAGWLGNGTTTSGAGLSPANGGTGGALITSTSGAGGFGGGGGGGFGGGGGGGYSGGGGGGWSNPGHWAGGAGSFNGGTNQNNSVGNTSNGQLVIQYSTSQTSDNCGIASMSLDQTSFTCSNVGANNVTVTVTDNNGNTATCAAVITVQDQIAPTALCQNVTIDLNASGTASTTAAAVNNGSSDACGIQSLTLSQTAFTCANTGANNVTLTVKDVNNNTSTCTAVVTVRDLIAPTAVCQNATVTLGANGTGTLAASAVNNGSSDNCSIQSLALSQTAFTCANTGANTVTLTVSDNSANTATCTATVTVVDNTAPTAVCQNTTVNLNASGAATITAATVNNGSSDACGIASTTIDISAFNCSNIGANTVTLTVTDVNNNTATCTATVTVQDIIAPTITCPANVAVNTDAGLCTATNVSLGSPSGADNCGTTNFSNNAPTTYAIGANAVTWTVNDGHGNTATCNQTVTVTDNELPTITCPTNVTVNANTGACNATGVALGTPTTADNCGIQNTSNNAPSSYALGVNTVIWTTRDAANNTATCAQTVTVIDNQAPVINCPAGTLTTIGSGSNPPGVNASIPNGTSYQSFTAPTSGLMQNVKVFFNSVFGDVTLNVYSGGTCQGTLLYTQTYTGITPGYKTLTLSNPLSVTAGGLYNFSVTASGGWSFQWSNSNPYNGGRFYFNGCPGNPLFPNGDLAFNVDILTAPNTNLALNSNCEVSLPNYVPQTTGSDNCGTPTITQSPAAGTILSGVGTQTVTMTATDGSGNTSTCSFDVTKVDNTAPTITCPATVNVNTDAGQCTATNVNLGAPAAADNCGMTNLSNNAPTTYPHGNTTVRWTVNDGHGNTATCNQTVTVTDVEAPNALCQNVTVQLNASGTGSTTAAAVNNGSTDNCAVQSLSLSKTTFNCSNVGANTVTLTVTDNHANTGTCTAIVTVQDNIAPVATCQNVTIALDANGAASTTAAAVNNGSSDACGIASLALNVSTFNCTNIGANTVTLTVTDNSSNTATCTATVTVQDNIAPVITCPSNVTVNTDAGICTASNVALGTATATDNCSTMTISNNAISIYPLGVTNVTWTVNDGNGNTASCIQTVTVLDNQLPTITCPANKTVNTDPAVCQATGVALGNAVAADNCTALTVSNNGLSIYPKGTTTVIWTANDGHGNTATCTQTVTVVDQEAPSYCTVDQSQTSTNVLYTHTERMRQSFTAAHTGTLKKITVRVGHSTGANVGLRMLLLAGAGPTGTVLASKTFTTTASNNTDMDVVFATPPTVISGQPYTYVVEEFPAVSGNLQVRVSSANPYSGGVFYSGTASALTPLATHDAYFKTWVCGCPNDVFVNSNPGICEATNVNLGAFTPTDNCDVPTVSNDAPGSFPLGVSFVTWTAQDASGNIFSCEQVVTVEDNEVPAITCPANLTVNTDAGACQASNVALGDAVATDNCNSTPQVVNDAPSVYPVGVTTITWLADDSNDNTATCAQTVTVRDVQAPTAVCQNLTLSLNAAGAASTTAAAINNGSSDACGIASMTINNSSFGCSNVGANTVTLTVTDNNANTATCTATVTVVDAIAPVVNCQNVSVSLNANGTGATTAAAVNNASYDACGIATMTLSQSNFDCSNVGANTVTLTVTDVNGNAATCNATVTVTDAIAPIALCQNSTVQLAANGTGSISATQVDNGSSDACGIQSMALSQTSFNCAQVGANTVTLTVTDVNGNASTCSAVITVVDAVAPLAVCQNVTVSLNTNGTGSTTAAAVNNGSSDACGIAYLALSATSFNCSNVGANPVTLTVTDVNGNSASCSATVTVVDAVAPVALCQNVSVSLDANGTGSTTATAVNNGSSDACGIASLALSATSFNCSNVGANPVTLTVTDINGNTSTCAATVTVTDAIAPVAICQNVTVSLNANGTGSTTAAAVNNGSSDACGIASMTINNSNFTCANVGANNVTLTVTDNNGNASTCAAVVTVQDLVAPNAICRNITVQLGANGTASTTVAAINNGSSDACGIASMTINTSAFTCANAGPNTVTLTVTDVNGNVSTCASTVTVQDIIKPVIACPAGLVADADPGLCTASNLPLGTATATDNCSVSNISSNAPAAMPKGINTVIWTATDASGNTATCTQIVEVQDNQSPIIACPADITVGTDPGNCTTTTVALGTPTATDNCGAPTVSNDAPSVYLPGQNEVVWTAVDAGGLTAYCVQTVTVQDNEGPVITCPATATVPVDAGACQATGAAIGLADAIDNCSSANVFDNAPAVFQLGSTTVTWTAFDEDGNTSTCTQIVTVVDNQPPNAICQNTSVSLNASGAATVTVQNIDNGSTDNCGISNYSLSKTAFNCSNIGANLVMLTVTDNSGNTASCAATVTVSDNTAPVALCRNITTQLNASGIVNITAASVNNGSGDACGIASLMLDETEFDCAEVGANTVILTVTDVNGNSSTCSAIVTVQDQVNPTAICQNVTVQLGSNGTGTLAAASVNNGSFDACGIATTTLNTTSFNCANVGANTVTLTVTDVYGNSSTCSAIATVRDQIAPVALCRNTTVALNAAGSATITASMINNGSSDACGIATTTLNTTNFGCSNVGANTVTLTVTDVNGNTNTCSATVTVQDNIAPVVTCQNATVNLNASGLATITAATVNGGVTDACGIATTTINISSFNCANTGANTVVFRATDVNGNSATCNAIVTIQDVTAPTTLCRNLNVNLDNSGNATITAADIDNGSSDACGIQNSVLSKTTFNCSNTGANTVTLTVTDINGNAGTCTATVTVTDNIAPLATCQDLNVQLSANGTATITAGSINNGSSDNCSIASTGINVSAFNCSNLGANTVTLTVTDNHGNSATCNATVTVTAIDTDNDGTSDCTDLCPNDPFKTSPGTCGCGTPDTDTDGDGTPDCNDQCPNDPNSTVPGPCGCGVVGDFDNDGIPNDLDIYPNDCYNGGKGVVFTRVWNDLNGNGLQDVGEPGVAGASLRLRDANTDVQLQTGTTNSDGYILFFNVTNSTSVRLEMTSHVAAPYNAAKPNIGANDNYDSDFDRVLNPLRVQSANFTVNGVVTNQDCGILVPGSVQAFVWDDANDNGLQDAGENGVSGATVRLRDGVSNTTSQTQTSNGSGLVTFNNVRVDGLDASSWKLEFVKPTTKHVYANADQGSDDTIDSDASTSTGYTSTFNLTLSAEAVTRHDAGFLLPGTIEAFVWQDGNDNGIQDVGEGPLSNVTVRLRDASTNGISQTKTTNASGIATFTAVTPRFNWKLEFVKPSGDHVYAQQDQGSNDALDSDPAAATGYTANFQITSGQNYTLMDAGFILPGTIQAYVWHDANNNGIQDNGEAPMQGVTVRLLNGNTDAISQTQTSNASGIASFSSVAARTNWKLEFVKPSANHQYAFQDQGSDDATDSDPSITNGRTAVFQLTSGASVTNIDGGFLLPGTVTAYVWNDLDGNGIQNAGEPAISGATVELRDGSNDNLVSSIVTNAAGTVTFTNVAPRTNWKLGFVKPSANHTYTLQNQGSDDAADSDAAASNGRSDVFQINSAADYTDTDAGFMLPGSIQSYVWHDANDNGVQDGGESPLSGVTVRLLDGTTNVTVDTKITGADGLATFSNVTPNYNWKLEYVKPTANHVYAFKDQGGNDANDSDMDETNGRTDVFTIGSGQNYQNADGGFLLPGSIESYVWNDANANGCQDEGTSAAVAGVSVRLRNASNNGLLQIKTTNANGVALFTNVKPRTNYKIEFIKPAAATAFTTPDNCSGNDASDSDAALSNGQTTVFQILSAEASTIWDAGVLIPSFGGAENRDETIAAKPENMRVLDEMILFPVPTTDQLTVAFRANMATETRYRVFDRIGNLLVEGKWNVEKGDNQFILETASLPSGIYHISVVANDGILTKQFMIVR